MSALTLYSNKIWNDRRVEPVKRNKDGVQWIVHRFPIRGGISLRDAMIYDMFLQPSPFFKLLKVA